MEVERREEGSEGVGEREGEIEVEWVLWYMRTHKAMSVKRLSENKNEGGTKRVCEH